ncbi:RING finger protein ETP1 homolog [Sparassis crispa]|uniref:RING finger protein ETP1 homolog n=1 Tax=Sparassis crispa TaxID=139825 RepID=A0A401GW18_9APHY|nr:RING finger protein ETP1 homolog [Sparassis crispa]GBE86383.1 RING finger protein ETP1 homolog [Sparassis crispa]
MSTVTSKKLVGKEKLDTDQGRAHEPVTAAFIAYRNKSGSTNLPEGVVHIYRECAPESGQEAPSPQPDDVTTTANPAAEQSNVLPDVDADVEGLTLAVLAVPSWMTPSDFLAFVAPAADGIAQLRMIRDSAPNRSIVVMKFRGDSDAAEFAETFNGKQFNSMEPEICHVVKVLSVSVDTDDPVSVALSRSSGEMYELPTCPVCLERMDSAVTGLVTVPCSHTFHCACLSKWGDSRCPVCRYSQTLLSSHPTSANTTRSSHPIPFSPPSATAQSLCADCGSTTNLWICLVCGNIGCGRYGRAHAHAHYTRTTHLYALELETQRVWDYAGDGYVHRLIQNKADGKLVELPSAAATVGSDRAGDAGGAGPSAADALSAEKIEAIGIEYSYLLTSQLDSQRAFYEEQTAELRTQVDQLRTLVEQLSVEVEKGRVSARDTEAKRTAEEQAREAELRKEKLKVEKRAEKAAELVQVLNKELREERAVSKGLLENLRSVKERSTQVGQEKAESLRKVQELEDQVRDLMFFLDAKSKIENGEGVAAEAAGGSIEVNSSPAVKKKSKR